MLKAEVAFRVVVTLLLLSLVLVDIYQMSFFFMIVTNWTGTKGRVATFANDIPVIVSESGLVSMMQNIIDIKIFKKIKILTEEYFA